MCVFVVLVVLFVLLCLQLTEINYKSIGSNMGARAVLAPIAKCIGSSTEHTMSAL